LVLIVKVIYNWDIEHSEYLDSIKLLSKEAKKRFYMASPYIGKDADEILGRIKAVKKKAIVDLSKASVGIGATNPWTVERLMQVAETKKIATLHAKIFVSDKKAIIGSANLSWNAFSRRIEAGVIIDEDEAVTAIVALF
jgi:phosphatidylserine/phosphatidylglycerophosphate/cardiolipin synthase-like enzyme